MAAQEKSDKILSANNKKTIALIQLTRIGDLVQTLIACKPLREQHPDVRLILIARPQFYSGIKFLLDEVFDEIYSFDPKVLIQDNLDRSKEEVKRLVSRLSVENISALINCTYSKPSAYLCQLIKADHKLGPWYDEHNNLRINDPWSQFVYSNVLETTLNPFNLVDLFKKIIGIRAEEKSQVTKEPPHNSRAHKITIHPFASASRKQWKPSKWSEIIYKILKDNPQVTITVLGSEKEKALADEMISKPTLKNLKHRIISKVGKTSIQDVYKLLKASDLFIGHDSLIGHLAALAGVQTLTVSLGTVRPTETTPYHANAYLLSPRTKCFPCKPNDHCDYFQCHSDISYQATSACINQLITTREISGDALEKNNSSFLIGAVDIYKSELNSESGFSLIKISTSPVSLADIYRKYYRIAWSFILDKKDLCTDFPELSSSTHKELYASLENIQQLYELNEFGKKYSRYILEEISSEAPKISKIKEFSHKIDEIDRLAELLSGANPYLGPIVNFYSVKKGNLKGDNIVQLAENSYLTYQEASNFCSVLHEFIEKNILQFKRSDDTATKPKSI